MNNSDSMGALLHEYKGDLLSLYPNTYGQWKSGACYLPDSATWIVQFLKDGQLVKFTRTRDGQETCQSRRLTGSERAIWQKCYSQHICQNFDTTPNV